jgi:hypothetical protein
MSKRLFTRPASQKQPNQATGTQGRVVVNASARSYSKLIEDAEKNHDITVFGGVIPRSSNEQEIGEGEPLFYSLLNPTDANQQPLVSSNLASFPLNVPAGFQGTEEVKRQKLYDSIAFAGVAEYNINYENHRPKDSGKLTSLIGGMGGLKNTGPKMLRSHLPVFWRVPTKAAPNGRQRAETVSMTPEMLREESSTLNHKYVASTQTFQRFLEALYLPTIICMRQSNAAQNAVRNGAAVPNGIMTEFDGAELGVFHPSATDIPAGTEQATLDEYNTCKRIAKDMAKAMARKFQQEDSCYPFMKDIGVEGTVLGGAYISGLMSRYIGVVHQNIEAGGEMIGDCEFRGTMQSILTELK